MVSEIMTLQVWDTNFCADSVEWCPIHPYENLLVCGTYQLQENKDETKSDASQIKIGSLYLMEFNEASMLSVKQAIEIPAVLDSKWCSKKLGNKIFLGVVNSVAEVLIYELLVDRLCSTLSLITKTTISEQSDVLALSLDWSAEQSSLTVSDSKGNISLLKFQESKLDIKFQWNAHSYEAWITAFDYWKPNVIYTGGDDCLFHMFDIRCCLNKPSVTSKAHNMGVTSLHCSVSQENIIASGRSNIPTVLLMINIISISHADWRGHFKHIKLTMNRVYVSREMRESNLRNGFGVAVCRSHNYPIFKTIIKMGSAEPVEGVIIICCIYNSQLRMFRFLSLTGPTIDFCYDESLRLWDVRQLRQPTTSFPLGGGIWRLKWHPCQKDYILAACMHFGSCAVKVNSGIVATYKEHSSMVYGADWCHKSSQQQLIATCSFYDHKLCISSLVLETNL